MSSALLLRQTKDKLSSEFMCEFGKYWHKFRKAIRTIDICRIFCWIFVFPFCHYLISIHVLYAHSIECVAAKHSKQNDKMNIVGYVIFFLITRQLFDVNQNATADTVISTTRTHNAFHLEDRYSPVGKCSTFSNIVYSFRSMSGMQNAFHSMENHVRTQTQIQTYNNHIKNDLKPIVYVMLGSMHCMHLWMQCGNVLDSLY